MKSLLHPLCPSLLFLICTLCSNACEYSLKVFSSHSALAKSDNQAPITESSLRERMLLSRAAMQQLGLASEDSGRNVNNGWFVLSSGRVNLDTDEVELESAQGVVEPLAWFLSLAGIARIKEA